MAKLLSDERLQKYRSEAEMGSQSLAELLGHIDALQAHWDSCRESYRAMETGYTGLVHKVQEFKDDAIIDHEAYIAELTLAVETQHEAQRRAEQAEAQLAEAMGLWRDVIAHSGGVERLPDIDGEGTHLSFITRGVHAKFFERAQILLEQPSAAYEGAK